MTWNFVILIGVMGIIWLYIAVRVIARAIFRSIDERKEHHG